MSVTSEKNSSVTLIHFYQCTLRIVLKMLTIWIWNEILLLGFLYDENSIEEYLEKERKGKETKLTGMKYVKVFIRISKQ